MTNIDLSLCFIRSIGVKNHERLRSGRNEVL